MEPSTLQIYRETVKKLSKATHPKNKIILCYLILIILRKISNFNRSNLISKRKRKKKREKKRFFSTKSKQY